MIDFRTFESLGNPKNDPVNSPVYIKEPQGKLRRTASVKVWDKVGVGKSGIDRLGVFCTDYIKKGECFEEAPILVLSEEVVKKTVLMDYVFKVDNMQYAIAFGNGSIYNHRNQPMAEWKIDIDRKLICFYALRDIEPGEEVFISYGKTYWKTRDIEMKKSPTLNKIK